MGTAKKKQLRWRRQPRETGLRAVCADVRGYELRLGEEHIASVTPWYTPGFGLRTHTGWYWSVNSLNSLGIPHKNTYSSKGPACDQHEAAKAEVKAFIKEHSA